MIHYKTVIAYYPPYSISNGDKYSNAMNGVASLQLSLECKLTAISKQNGRLLQYKVLAFRREPETEPEPDLFFPTRNMKSH